MLLRWCVVVAVVAVHLVFAEVRNRKQEPDDLDYLDGIKDSAAHQEEVNARYSARINKMDMLEDYPQDEDDDYHPHHGTPDYDDDYDDDDDDDDDDDEDDDDDDDDDDGGCGGDDDDEDDEEPNPVEEVIDEYFTR
ncbi:prostatic spermine-binding protein-like isoform X2 [Portunus trituberculatus]|nr:prostatic spermine-binding protein-like isoform X2 [Portunus trituberculatus]